MGKFRTRKRVVVCYPGAVIDFIKDILKVAYESRDFIIHVGGNNISNMDGTFERLEILLKKYRELLVIATDIGKTVV